MIDYDPNDAQQEFLLEVLFHQLRASDDLKRTFHTSLHSVTQFLGYFRNQARLMLEAETKGIWFTAWCDQVL